MSDKDFDIDTPATPEELGLTADDADTLDVAAQTARMADEKAESDAEFEKFAKEAEADSADDADVVDKVEAKDDKPKPKADKTVPYSRLSEVVQERNAAAERAERAERKLALLENPVKDAPAVNFKAKEREAAEALADGDYDRYADIKEEIEGARMRIAEEKAFERANSAMLDRETKREIAANQAKLEETAEVLAAKYPFFDARVEGHNAEGLAEAMDYAQSLIDKKGMAPHRALEKAVEMFAKVYAPDGFSTQAQGSQAATPKNTVKEAQKARDRAALEKAVDAASRQPGQAGVGSRGLDDMPDLSKLTPDQLEKLPEAKRREFLMRMS